MKRHGSDMDRYQIVTGKDVPVPKKENISMPKIKGRNVKKLTQEWTIEDSSYFVALEISPRNATCSKYECKNKNKKIIKGTPRYKVIYKNGFYNETRLYHRSCLPFKVKKFIKEYSTRNISKEITDDVYNRVIRDLTYADEENVGIKYHKKLLKKLENYIERLK